MLGTPVKGHWLGIWLTGLKYAAASTATQMGGRQGMTSSGLSNSQVAGFSPSALSASGAAASGRIGREEREDL